MEKVIYKYLFFLGVLSICVVSCKGLSEDIDPEKLGSIKPSLVISGSISPEDTLIRIYVGETQPVFKPIHIEETYELVNGEIVRRVVEGDPKVRNGIVTLTSLGKSIVLKYDFKNECYSVVPGKETIEILPGNTYELKVEHGNRTAIASTTIPDQIVSLESFSVDSSKVYFSREISYVNQVRLRWKAKEGDKSYFKPRASGVFFYESVHIGIEKDSLVKGYRSRAFEFYDASFVESGYENKREFEVVGDLSHSGLYEDAPYHKYITGEVKYGIGSGFFKAISLKEVSFELMQIDEHFYKYQTSVRKYFKNYDNPFVEPTEIYSNVKGGVGYFGGYRLYTIKRKVSGFNNAGTTELF